MQDIPQAPLTPIESVQTPVQAPTQSATSPQGTSQIDYGEFWRRGAAIIADSFIVGFISIPFLLVFQAFILHFIYLPSFYQTTSPDLVVNFGNENLLRALEWLIRFLIFAIYDIIMLSKQGATFGKKWAGLKVVTLDLQKPTFVKIVLRELIGRLISVLTIIGFLWALIDKRRQTWHDKIAGTIVIYTRPRKK